MLQAPLLQHEDHHGMLQANGRLACMVDGRLAEHVVEDCVAHDHAHTPPHLASVLHEDGKHEHGPACGHAAVEHNGHIDYLVGSALHHRTADGECHTHGHVHVVQDSQLEALRRRTALRRRSTSRVLKGHHHSVPYSPLVQKQHSRSVSDLDSAASLSFSSRAQSHSHSPSHGGGDHREDHYAFEPPVAGEEDRTARPWYRNPNTMRFFAMVFLTGSFMFIEFVYGTISGSLALVADSYHMLSDLIAMLLGFYATRVVLRDANEQATYGHTRFEIVAGLVNGVFLMAMCLQIVIEAVQRMVNMLQHPGESGGGEHGGNLEENAETVMIVAAVGLGINVIGLFIFGEHGHSHGGGGGSHGHSHGGHGGHGGHDYEHDHDEDLPSDAPHRDMNVQAVFLHVLGDALGSVAVLISGAVIHYSDSRYRFLSDPISSLLITCIISYSTIPLLKHSARMLQQHVPDDISLPRLKERLLAVERVVELHDVHVWQLNASQKIASLHVMLEPGADFLEVCDHLKMILHKYGIHSSTVQPEFRLAMERTARFDEENCHDPVCTSAQCVKASCCRPRKAPTCCEQFEEEATKAADMDEEAGRLESV